MIVSTSNTVLTLSGIPSATARIGNMRPERRMSGGHNSEYRYLFTGGGTNILTTFNFPSFVPGITSSIDIYSGTRNNVFYSFSSVQILTNGSSTDATISTPSWATTRRRDADTNVTNLLPDINVMALLLGRLTTGIRGSFLFMFTPTSVLFRARRTMRICGDVLAQYSNNPSISTYRLGRYIECIPPDCTIQTGTWRDLASSLVLSYCSVHSVSSVTNNRT